MKTKRSPITNALPDSYEFSIRDLFLVTAIAALVAAWAIDYRRKAEKFRS